MVVLLFEGVQGVGKSTLLRTLASVDSVTDAQLPRPKGATAHTYTRINQLHTESAKDIILKLASAKAHCYGVDRYIASEYAFGHVCSREQDYTWLMSIDDELAKCKNVYTVYITAPRQFIADNIWARRGQYTAELMLMQLDPVLKYFEEYLSLSKIPVIRFANNPQLGILRNAVLLWKAIEEQVMHE